MNYYMVTFQWYDTTTYCCNLAHAADENAVKEAYKEYNIIDIRPADPYEISTARIKGMPCTECR